MVRLGVLVSGDGSNLQAILDAIEAGALKARVAVVVSNRRSAYALERARRLGIDTAVVEHGAFASREKFDEALVQELSRRGVELVVLAGFMRIVTSVLLSAFPDRVVNVHPALLPAFPGLDAQEQAMAYGARIAGCTVHFVDGGTDTGPIIAQVAVPVRSTDRPDDLRRRILAEEHRLYPRVLQWFAEGRVHLERPTSGGRPRVRVEGVEPWSFGGLEG